MSTALLHDHLMFIGETQGDPEVEKRLDQQHGRPRCRRIRLRLDVHPLRPDLQDPARASGGAAELPDAHQGVPRRRPRRTGGRVEPRPGNCSSTATAIGSCWSANGHRTSSPRRNGSPVSRRCSQQQGTELAGSIDALWWPEYAYEAVRAYLKEGHRPTAFICLNDRLALGTYQAAQSLGLSAPQDFSVISFDDSDLAGWLQPQLSSIAIPHFEMARRAVEILLAPERHTGRRTHPDAAARPGLGRRTTGEARRRAGRGS